MEKILVVEDEKKINDLVRDYLVSLGFEVVQAFDGPSALVLAADQGPDLVVLDLMIPGLDGVEVARRLRRSQSVPIIMLTARDAEADKLLGLEVGADDYMTKPFSVRELSARIRAVLRRTGRTGAEPRVLSHGGLVLDPVRRSVTKAGRPVCLTSAQFEILRVLLGQPGRVFTRQELVEAVSGSAYEGYERTVDVQVKNIRKQIEENPGEPRLLVTVWRVGYKLEE